MEQTNILMVTPFEQWENFYDWGYCTQADLQMLAEYGVLTQEQVEEIIASKPDFTGRVVDPIPKGGSTSTGSSTSTSTPTSDNSTPTGTETPTGDNTSTPSTSTQPVAESTPNASTSEPTQQATN